MLSCIFAAIKTDIIRQHDHKITELRSSFPNDARHYKHAFQQNSAGDFYASEFWNLPIIQVTSITGFGRCSFGIDETSWAEFLHDLGKSGTGQQKYLVAMGGTVPCIVYLDVGGHDGNPLNHHH